MSKKIIALCLLCTMLLLGKEGAVNVQAAYLTNNEMTFINEEKASSSIYGKYIDINTSGKAVKLVISMPELRGGEKAEVALCNNKVDMISEWSKIKNSSQTITYYLRGGSKFFIYTVSNMKNAKFKIKKTSESVSSGNSFDNATTIKPGTTKKDVIGFNMGYTRQYFKIKVNKEKLVKIKFTKSESSSKNDMMCINIYKSNNKKSSVASGYLYEGQKNGYILIRNSTNHKTEPGTYYIAVKKCYSDAGFQYSISY